MEHFINENGVCLFYLTFIGEWEAAVREGEIEAWSIYMYSILCFDFIHLIKCNGNPHILFVSMSDTHHVNIFLIFFEETPWKPCLLSGTLASVKGEMETQSVYFYCEWHHPLFCTIYLFFFTVLGKETPWKACLLSRPMIHSGLDIKTQPGCNEMHLHITILADLTARL